MKKNISETDVILNFMEDCIKSKTKSLNFEFPAGSWQGSKCRSIADIHGKDIHGIEAKGNFIDCKKDFLNPVKNAGISHYIFSSKNKQTLHEEEKNFFKKNNLNACCYLTEQNKWVIIEDKQGVFNDLLVADKVIN